MFALPAAEAYNESMRMLSPAAKLSVGYPTETVAGASLVTETFTPPTGAGELSRTCNGAVRPTPTTGVPRSWRMIVGVSGWPLAVKTAGLTPVTRASSVLVPGDAPIRQLPTRA